MGSELRWRSPFPGGSDRKAERVEAELRKFAAKYAKCLVPRCSAPPSDLLRESNVPLCGGHAHVVLVRFDASLPVPPSSEPEEPEAPEPGAKVGTVYYLLVGEAIKIGWTTDLERRMREYSPGAQLLAIETGPRKLELARHHLFNEFLLYGREWFSDGPELREHLKRVIRRNGPPPDLGTWRPATKQDGLPGTLKTRGRGDRRHQHDGSAAVKRRAS